MNIICIVMLFCRPFSRKKTSHVCMWYVWVLFPVWLSCFIELELATDLIGGALRGNWWIRLIECAGRGPTLGGFWLAIFLVGAAALPSSLQLPIKSIGIKTRFLTGPTWAYKHMLALGNSQENSHPFPCHFWRNHEPIVSRWMNKLNCYI